MLHHLLFFVTKVNKTTVGLFVLKTVGHDNSKVDNSKVALYEPHDALKSAHNVFFWPLGMCQMILPGGIYAL